MRALVFAAGRGARMRPLTDAVPKPLLIAGGKRLIEWQLEALARAGIVDVVVNISYLRDAFAPTLGDGSRYGVRIDYSNEGDVPLETGGGMHNALPLLGAAPFVVVNADVWCDLDLNTLPRAPEGLAHIVLVANPPHHPRGDFVLADDDRVVGDHRTGERLTYSGIGVFRPALLDGWGSVIGDREGASATPPRFPLAPLIRAAIERGLVTGSRHDGAWSDVGTPERLAELEARLHRT